MKKINLSQLAEFHAQADDKTFRQILGESIGMHVWQKFANNDHQLPLYALDHYTRAKISEYIYEKYPAVIPQV